MAQADGGDAAQAVPANREFVLLAVCYGLYTAGLFMFWTSVVGVIVAYFKRDGVADTFLASHYRWLIRTFWTWVGVWAVVIVAIVALVFGSAIDLLALAHGRTEINLPWGLLAALSGLGLLLALVWFWVVYRLVRGAIRLADSQPAPG